jgi:hypothetical protein
MSIKKYVMLLWICGNVCFAQEEKPKILFIGNSFFKDTMTTMLKTMLNHSKKSLKSTIYSATMGSELKQHLKFLKYNTKQSDTDPNSLILGVNTLKDIKFDFVVLQEGTVSTLIPELRYELYKNIKELDSLIRDSGGKTILYQNYPIYKYPEMYCWPNPKKHKSVEKDVICSREFFNSREEQQVITNSFNKVGNELHLKITRIGQAFEYCRKVYPKHKILNNGNQEPSKLGSYLIAVLLYKAITNTEMTSYGLFAGITLEQEKHISNVCKVIK